MRYQEAKKQYVQAREEERKGLVEELIKKGYKVCKRGGIGRSDFTAGNSIGAFDLSNFFYIDAAKGDDKFFITFQPIVTNPNTNNTVVLEDRIGISKCSGSYNINNAARNMKVLDIDLPLSLNDYKKIIKVMEAW